MKNPLSSHPNLRVGDCVPFYFCPRSVMLYVLHRGNDQDLAYRGGQEPILHLQFDLRAVVDWADANARHWAFTTSNAGSGFFEDYSDLAQLEQINWRAVESLDFRERDVKEGKQAEFLVQERVPWELVEEIGIHAQGPVKRVEYLLRGWEDRPALQKRPEWYY